MARKRPNVAKKRVLTKAANKNISFVVESIPELKKEIVTKPALRTGKKANDEKSIDIQPGPSGKSMVVIHDYSFDRIPGSYDSDAEDEDEDINMEEPSMLPSSQPSLITRTYSRKRSIVEQIIQEWNDDVVASSSTVNIHKNAIQSCSTDPFSEQQIGSPSGEANANLQPECFCGKAKEAEKYKLLSESLQKEIDALRTKNSKLEAQNGKLLESLTSKLLPVPEKPFVEEEGFYDCETLKKMSHEAGDSDYSFVKFLMMKLWPEGFAGRSVTGRSSNNPSGRPKNTKEDQTTSQAENESSQDTSEAAGSKTDERIKRVPLEEAKVEYIGNRLYDRRIFLRDDVTTAKAISKAGTRLMARVIANSLRK